MHTLARVCILYDSGQGRQKRPPLAIARVASRERRAASNGDISGYYGSIHHPPRPNSKLMSSEREREKLSEDTLVLLPYAYSTSSMHTVHTLYYAIQY